MLDDYLQQLVEEGDLDSHGRITLDASKARQKLAESRFSRSSEGLLAVIAAALLGGASQIKIACARSGWEIHCDARPPEPAELENLMRDLFRQDQSPLLRELGLAFNSLFPKHCEALEMVAGDRRGWFEGGEWKAQAIPVPTPGWEVRIQRQASISQWWRWILRRWAPASDLQILQARTRWSPAPVLFEEKGQWRSSYDLEPPVLPTATMATLYIESQKTGLGLPNYPGSEHYFCHQRTTRSRTSLRCVLLPGDPRASQLLLVYRGLILARHHLNGQTLCFHGVINTDSLDLDASRQHVVQNQRLRQRIETARQWVLEGTAAWLRQLDPQKVNGDLLIFLRQLLNRLNLSSNNQPLLSALDPLPLIILGDGVSSLTLGELRQSLARFPALHTGSERELHDRPLLHPGGNNIKKLARLLKVPIVDATPWSKYKAAPSSGEPVVSYARYLLRGTTWEATINLPQDFHLGNRLTVTRRGIPFSSRKGGLFESLQVPTSFQIGLEGELDGALDSAENSLIKELKSAILGRSEDWLAQFRQEAREGKIHRLHLEHYTSLLLLWMKAEGALRHPPVEWLEYPLGHQGISLPTRAADHVDSLSQLLQNRLLLKELRQDHPAQRLAEWL